MRNVVAATAVAAVLLLLGAGVAPAGTGPSTIRITAVQEWMHTVDRSGRADRGGDLEIVRLRLYNPSITPRPIGRGDLLCTFVDTTSRSCSGTYSLPRGRLVVSGLVTTRLLYELAVVGGTGLYDNARGTVVITATSFKPRKELLVFRLSG